MVLRKHELEGKLGEESQMIKSGVIRDENPLDTSVEFNSFIEACRRGSLKRCQELIDAGVNINGKDRFDYTPLIVVRPPTLLPSSPVNSPGKSMWTLRACPAASRVR